VSTIPFSPFSPPALVSLVVVALLAAASPALASDGPAPGGGDRPRTEVEGERESDRVSEGKGTGENDDEREAVVLLHGLGRSDRSMRPLARRLAAAGFRVENIGYPSLTESPEALVAQLRARIRECCADAPRVHFVTHSLGGILLRAILAGTPPTEAGHDALPGIVVGRVVMLAPPNQGSELVDALRQLDLFEWMLGPTAPRLGTGDDSLPKSLPPPTYEVGVIAGNVGINPLGAALLEGANDGTVSVESTRLPGMTDFLVVPHSHPFIMQSETVADQVLEFLRQGHFRHDTAP
jgi:pimeloyl-ACP methyl ester carboxylesterase